MSHTYILMAISADDLPWWWWVGSDILHQHWGGDDLLQVIELRIKNRCG